jgi:hypothetical protein
MFPPFIFLLEIQARTAENAEDAEEKRRRNEGDWMCAMLGAGELANATDIHLATSGLRSNSLLSFLCVLRALCGERFDLEY